MAKKKRPVIEREEVVVKFVGDSGDGMQLTGNMFSDVAAIVGNDLLHSLISPLRSVPLRTP